MPAHVDLAFPISSASPVPADHGYHLYSAISRLLPAVHRRGGIGIHPIRGTQIGDRQLALNHRSHLVFRTPSEALGELVQLGGKQLDIAGRGLCIGVPAVWALKPAAALRSRLVIIKVKEAPSAAALNEENFRHAARKQLEALSVSPGTKITLGKRRSLRIKDKEIVGYEVVLHDLRAEESLAIQEKGIGGRRHMGCGVFVPSGRGPR